MKESYSVGKGSEINLSHNETVLVSAILDLGEPYGLEVAERAEDVYGLRISLGSIYTTLDRLEQKGLVSSRYAEPDEERGGRPKRFFQVTGLGVSALEAAKARSHRLVEVWGL